jgi:hypothetical protein
VAFEEWDHPLPVGGDPRIALAALPVLNGESEAKWRQISRTMSESDYLVLASRRAYATVGRLGTRFPATALYYEKLFSGELGYRPIACFGREPAITFFSFRDDPTFGLAFELPDICAAGRGERRTLVLGRIDESLVVYDHPATIIFERVGPVPDLRELRTESRPKAVVPPPASLGER